MSERRPRSGPTHGAEQIDFVVTWAGPMDGKQRARRREAWEAAGRPLSDPETSYRDWGTLRYWFRAVEAYAPWVRRVHLIAPDLPTWLRDDHPQLAFVSADTITGTRNPTYNSLAIEASIPQVPDLAERFVSFNDDFFLNRPVTPGFYFPRGRPYAFPFPFMLTTGDVHSHALLNSVDALNRHAHRRTFVRTVLRSSRPSLGRDLLRLPMFAFSTRIPSISDLHLPLPLLKSAMADALADEAEVVERTRRAPFRDNDQIHAVHYASMRLVADGNFTPISARRAGRRFALGRDRIEDVEQALTDPRVAQICLNDEADVFEPALREQLLAACQRKLPAPSTFER